ncbi:NAD-dependent epimerase/dehydratase [Tolumonas auensis DSM 9187]|uniref:NAD-dependent epimerase/dehydratase n=1 Tax=Tolumonas auensis (strain DSM 9187 / NBRC 110442 / TA 4) TaxID=595494 RepID=C4LEJ7_TOLAT|nr:NAD(P)-dependent oxidoreductase [Tolumonas auensis]ACQ93014.1 NAD-dependent epimerase/dehydratase [Tolumonas auensis DSM 9187]
MKLAIIGATGFVGSAVLQEALQQGHDVTAIVRHPEKLAVHPSLTAKAVSVFDEAALADVLRGHDAVISAYNPGWTNPNIQSQMIEGSAHIVNATKQAKVPSLLVVGGAGSLEVAPGVQLVDTPQFPAEWKEGALGAREVLNQLKNEKELNWRFISPAVFLEPGKRTGQFRYGDDAVLFNDDQPARISVEDLAVAIVEEIAAPRYNQRRFTVAY